MSELFVVTSDDMALLELHQIDKVWDALGVIVKARAVVDRTSAKPATNVVLSRPDFEMLMGIALRRAEAFHDGGIRVVVPAATEPPLPLHPTDLAGTSLASPEPAPPLDIPAHDVSEEIAHPEPAEEVRDQPPPPATSKPARVAVPLGPLMITCEPGCKKRFTQEAIAAHRRGCPAVIKFKKERGVKVLPDRFGEPAPLPEPPASDFDAKRDQQAKAAAERTWQATHPGEPERASAVPTGDTWTLGPNVVERPLTDRQMEVLTAIREHGGMAAACRERGWSYKAVENVVGNLRRGDRLPGDVQAILDANLSLGRRAPSAGTVPARVGQRVYVRSAEAREHMRQAQIDSRRRRGLPVSEAAS